MLVPVTLFLIFFMLFMHRGSLIETLLVMLSVPISLSGAVWLMWWLDFNLSVAVWVGMIAVAGLAVELGLLMMVYLDIAWRDREAERRLNTRGDMTEVVQSGAGQRIRPMLMTGLSTFIGLVPILFASGTGADVMQRIAAPMVGGVISALLMVLVVYPAIFMLWRGRGLPKGAPTPPLKT